MEQSNDNKPRPGQIIVLILLGITLIANIFALYNQYMMHLEMAK